MLRKLKLPGACNSALKSITMQDAAAMPRHRWYYFKEAFSPTIVSRAVERHGIGPDGRIVDPFCGSGTVPLEAAIQGRAAIGVEVNPFLAFVSRTKLQQCKPTVLKRELRRAVRGAKQGKVSPLESFSTFSEGKGKDKWLFNRRVLRAFEGAWASAPSRRSGAGKLVRLALLGAAMDTCNAVRDGKCLRYTTTWQEDAFGAKDFVEALETRIGVMCQDLKERPIRSSSTPILLSDVRAIDVHRPFNLCITSPPYLNSFDYSDVYRPELFLGRFVATMRQLRSIRRRTVRSHVQASWKPPAEKDFGTVYQNVMTVVNERAEDLWDHRIPMMIQAYFEDMKTVLRNLRRAALPRASAWLVVSTSAYAGVEIPVDLIIGGIAKSVGWKVREIAMLRALNRVAVQQWERLSQGASGRPQLRESLVILDA